MESSHQPIWALDDEAVSSTLGTSPNGLSENNAYQRFIKFGANELPEPPHRPLWLRFTSQILLLPKQGN